MLTRAELKQRAKEAMSTATTHPVLVALVYIVISMAISGIIGVVSNIFGFTIGMGAAVTNSASFAIGSSIFAMCFSLVLSIASSAIIYTLAIGLYTYYLKTIRHQEAGLETLFSQFKSCVRIFCLYFMMGLFIFLWSLLFVIPGIIAAYRYAMAPYIFIDDPSKGIMQCISESKEMMVGHKWDFFVLQLSFILWGLLCCVTCGIASLYVTPYIGLTATLFYDNLKFISQPNNMQTAPDFGDTTADSSTVTM